MSTENEYNFDNTAYSFIKRILDPTYYQCNKKYLDSCFSWQFSHASSLAVNQAVDEKNLKVVKHLLKTGKLDVNTVDCFGNSALHQVCSSGYFKMAELLIVKGIIVNMKNCYQETALHHACKEGHKKLVELLLRHNADFCAVNERNDTCLTIAVSYERMEVVKTLLQHGADPNYIPPLETLKTPNWRTSMHAAASASVDDFLRLLMTFGGNIDIKDSNGETPLFTACKYDHKQIVEFLVENGCNVTVLTSLGNSAIAYACKNDNVQLVKYLLQIAGCTLQAPNSQLFKFYFDVELCCLHINEDLIRLLIQADYMLYRELKLLPVDVYINNKLTKLIQVHNLSLSTSVQKYTEELKPLLTWLKNTSECPLTLQQLCRVVVRNCIGVKPILKISTLSMPEPLKKYLSYEDLE